MMLFSKQYSNILRVSCYVFDSSDRRSLNTRASIVSHVVLTYKDFDRTRYTEYNCSLVYVDILCQNG